METNMLFGGITASILLGMVSGGIGVKTTDGLDSQHAGWLLGASLMLASLLLWQRGVSSSCGKHGMKYDFMFRGSMFDMGVMNGWVEI